MTAEDWLKLINKGPKDPVRKLAFADWLEEHNEPFLAEAWRWIVREGKSPLRQASAFLAGHPPFPSNSYDWCHYNFVDSEDSEELPKSLFKALRPVDPINNQQWFKEYPTPGAAFAELARVVALREKRKARRREKNRS